MNMLMAFLSVLSMLWLVSRLVSWLPVFYAREEAMWVEMVCRSADAHHDHERASLITPAPLALLRELFSAMPPLTLWTGIAMVGVVLLALLLLVFSGLPTSVSILWFFYGCVLIVLALVDAQTKLLPDILAIPMVWVGILIQLYPMTASVGLELAVIGAVSGYVPLWLLAQAFRQLRGRDGLGNGDLKLLAAMGAWSGPWVLPQVIFLAALLAILAFVVMRFRQGSTGIHEERPFGPWIVMAYLLSIVPPVVL